MGRRNNHTVAQMVSNEVLSGDDVVALVSTALAQTNRSGLREVLRVVAQTLGAHGCLLWQLAPGAKLDSDPPEGRLFVLADWLSDNTVYASHDLRLNSVTGEAIVLDESQNV